MILSRPADAGVDKIILQNNEQQNDLKIQQRIYRE